MVEPALAAPVPSANAFIAQMGGDARGETR
jgi:hypothetical protein